MENKNQALEFFEFIIESSKSEQIGRDLFLSFRDKLQQLGFVIQEGAGYCSAFPELCDYQACSTINIIAKTTLKKYINRDDQMNLLKKNFIIEFFCEKQDKKNYEIVSPRVGYILDDSIEMQDSFLRLILNIIRRYIIFYGDDKEKENLIKAFIEYLHKLFPFTALSIGENIQSKEIPDLTFSLQRKYIAEAISVLSFYCNGGYTLRLFIENFSKYFFTFDTFRDCFIIQKKEKSEFLFDIYSYHMFSKPRYPEGIYSEIIKTLFYKKQSDEYYNNITSYHPTSKEEDFKSAIYNKFTQIELENFLDLCGDSDLYFIQGLLSHIKIDMDKKYIQQRLKAFKDCFMDLIDNTIKLIKELEKIKDINIKSNSIIVLSEDFKNAVDNVTIDNISSFVKKYNLDEDGVLFCQVTKIDALSEKNLPAECYRKYNIKRYSSILKKVETFRDIIPGMLNYEEKPVAFFIELYNKIIDEHFNECIERIISRYKNYFNDEAEREKKVFNFFSSAEGNLKPLVEEYHQIKNNKKLVDILVASQIFKEDLDKNAAIYNAIPGGDYTLFVVGFIKAVERYLKEMQIQNPSFSKGLWFYGKCLPLKRNKDFIIEFDKSYKNLPTDQHRNPTNITLANLSHSFDYYFQQLGNNSNFFKDDFRKEFINKVRNGKLHVKAIESYVEAQNIYKKTAYYFRKCIDEFNFELKT